MANHGVPYLEAVYAQQPVASPAPRAQGNNAGHPIPAGMAEPGMNPPAVEPKGEKRIPSDEGILEPRYEGFVFCLCKSRKDRKEETGVKRKAMTGNQNDLKKMVGKRPIEKENLRQLSPFTKVLHSKAEKWVEKLNNEHPGFKWTLAYEKAKDERELGVILKREVKREKPILSATPEQFAGNDAAGNVYASVEPNEPHRQLQDIDPYYESNIQQQHPLANISIPYAPYPQRPAHGLPSNFNVQPGYAEAQQQQQHSQQHRQQHRQQPPHPPPPNYIPNHRVWYNNPDKHKKPQFGDVGHLSSDFTDHSTATQDDSSWGTMSEVSVDSHSYESDYSGPRSTFHKKKPSRREKTREKSRPVSEKLIHPASPSPLPPLPAAAAAPPPPPAPSAAPSAAPSTAAAAAAAAAEGVPSVPDPQLRCVNHYHPIVIYHKHLYCEGPRHGMIAHRYHPCFEASRHRGIHEEPLCHAPYSSSYENTLNLPSCERHHCGSYDRRSSHEARYHDFPRHHCHCNL